MLNFEVQNTLAKLLARENVTVQHGNYSTAFFDVEQRVLGLPIWKNRGKDVYDLLVGHEVGHALFTPPEGWHESVTDLGLPRSYINVVEDIRIERLIQSKYPGLVSSFKRGYKVLSDEDFFGLSQVSDVNTLGLMDRINIKSKLRDLVDVQFSDEEKPLVDMAFTASTFEQVLEACKAIHDFLKDKKDDDEQPEPEGDNDPSEDSAEYPSDADESNGDAPSSDGSSDDNEESEPNPSPEESQGDSSEGQSNEEVEEEDRVVTDEAFRQNEENLIESDNRGHQPAYIKALTRQQTDESVVGYKETMRLRAEHAATVDPTYLKMYNHEIERFAGQFVDFKAETKKFVNLMGKEFEMRKAAYQNLRAQSARSGSLDVNKLHSYKYTDDIFMRVTQLADAKSHGMVMYIDFSGSMSSILRDTIKQCLTLASFCKKVNIPFDVYSFTSKSSDDLPVGPGEIEHERLHVVQLLSSSMKKAEFELAYEQLFYMGASYSTYSREIFWSNSENLGGTPLNETIMASRFMLRDFKKKHGVQKVNAVFLTDGEAQTFRYKSAGDLPTRGFAVDVDGKVLTGTSTRYLTNELMGLLGEEFTTIGYFLCERSYDFKGQIWACSDEYVSSEKMAEYRKLYNKNKFVALDKARGYDRYFIVKAENNSMNTDNEEFEVDENAKKGEIARAFKKYANSKKSNRMLATQFAEMVA